MRGKPTALSRDRVPPKSSPGFCSVSSWGCASWRGSARNGRCWRAQSWWLLRCSNLAETAELFPTDPPNACPVAKLISQGEYCLRMPGHTEIISSEEGPAAATVRWAPAMANRTVRPAKEAQGYFQEMCDGND